jgi:hypothetical protein
MSKGKNQHVVKYPDGWAVKGAGNSKATKVTRTQQEAIDVAEQIQKFTVEMERFVLVTATAMTHTHRKTQNKDIYDYFGNVYYFFEQSCY